MKSHEKNFIKRLKRQKEDALDFIVDTYLPLVKGVTYKILAPIGNPGIIDECINDVFLSVWNHTLANYGGVEMIDGVFREAPIIEKTGINNKKFNLEEIVIDVKK
ncbi:hypothetical protein ACFDTO_33490 [Microbacteriaceae bacterium 4G12]